jgi:RNA polymerase sigma-70 factor (ECF subfamily)
MTDREIIELFHSGKREQAFQEIVSMYSERLYGHIRRFTCSHEDTDDLLQDIYVKIWAALPSFREEARLFTWLWKIATNETLNHLRKQKIRSMFSLEDYTEKLASRIDDDPSFNGDELQRELHKAIQRLPEKQRLVFNMRYFDELKYEEISEILGTSVGALKASYHHAYTKIKEELQKKF